MSFNSIMLFGIINEANFYVVIIAVIVVFFLLGIIIGNLTKKSKEDEKDSNDKKKLGKAAADKPKQMDTQAQDNDEDMDNPDSNKKPTQRDPRYRYYNWW